MPRFGPIYDCNLVSSQQNADERLWQYRNGELSISGGRRGQCTRMYSTPYCLVRHHARNEGQIPSRLRQHYCRPLPDIMLLATTVGAPDPLEPVLCHKFVPFLLSQEGNLCVSV